LQHCGTTNLPSRAIVGIRNVSLSPLCVIHIYWVFCLLDMKPIRNHVRLPSGSIGPMATDDEVPMVEREHVLYGFCTYAYISMNHNDSFMIAGRVSMYVRGGKSPRVTIRQSEISYHRSNITRLQYNQKVALSDPHCLHILGLYSSPVQVRFGAC